MRPARGLAIGAAIALVLWAAIAGAAWVVLTGPSPAGAQTPATPLVSVSVDTRALEALIIDHERRLRALEAVASATAAPTATGSATATPSVAPTATPPPAPAVSGLMQVAGWDVGTSAVTQARAAGASIVKISASFPHRRTSDLSQSELQRLTASLQTVRNAGMQAVVRFSYWYHWDEPEPLNFRIDAQPAQAHRHVDQLAAVINANADVVLVVEAGQVGKWGEWHYHNIPAQFRTYGERSLSNSTTGARADLVRKLLDTYQVPVAFRYPRDIRWMWGFLNDSQKSRVAMHNDAVLTEPGEWGTWESGVTAGETDEQWLRRVFLSTPRTVGGEFGESTGYNAQSMASAYLSLAWRQYAYHSHDSGAPTRALLESMSHPRGGSYWDDIVRNLGRWP